jgi:hypothetical protein
VILTPAGFSSGKDCTIPTFRLSVRRKFFATVAQAFSTGEANSIKRIQDVFICRSDCLQVPRSDRERARQAKGEPFYLFGLCMRIRCHLLLGDLYKHWAKSHPPVSLLALRAPNA